MANIKRFPNVLYGFFYLAASSAALYNILPIRHREVKKDIQKEKIMICFVPQYTYQNDLLTS